jgi:hypothetical protein
MELVAGCGCWAPLVLPRSAGLFYAAAVRAAATSCHALIPRSPAVGVRLRVRLFGALGRVRDASGFPSVPFRVPGSGFPSVP